mmetsp:Transcript_8970/g.29714  ORF Transcript_8970/g.29714 Transcript_8970/m.29714 type:complete len:233 (+) Transcript_8970:542-1240(+)
MGAPRPQARRRRSPRRERTQQDAKADAKCKLAEGEREAHACGRRCLVRRSGGGGRAESQQHERRRHRRLCDEGGRLCQGALRKQLIGLRVDPAGLARRLNNRSCTGHDERGPRLGGAHQLVPLATHAGRGRRRGHQQGGEDGRRCRQPRHIHATRERRAVPARVDALGGAAQALLWQEEEGGAHELQLHIRKSVPRRPEPPREQRVQSEGEEPGEELQCKERAEAAHSNCRL